MTEQQSYTYLGLAGETAPGRPVDSGLFRLADGSREWEALRRGLPEKPAVRALAVHPTNPAIIYAGTQSGPYRSTDRGEHWTHAAEGLPSETSVKTIVGDPARPNVVFAGTEGRGVYRSVDGGATWVSSLRRR